MGAARKHTYRLISANKELQFHSKLKHIDIFGMTDNPLKSSKRQQQHKQTKVGRPADTEPAACTGTPVSQHSHAP